MGPVVAMDFELVREVVKAFQEAEQTLDYCEDRLKLMQDNINRSGDLSGRAMFALIFHLQRVQENSHKAKERMQDMWKDVDAARRALEEGDTTAAGRFSG